MSDLDNHKSHIDIILFGAGKKAGELFERITYRYNVKMWIDNDKNLWGTQVNGITISPPKDLEHLREHVFVSTGISSYWDIIVQLNEIGIKKDRIHWITESSWEDDIYIVPALLCTHEISRKSLEQYDLLSHREIHNTSNMSTARIMVMCSFFTTYTITLIKNIKQRYSNYEISIITQSDEYNVIMNCVEHIYRYKYLDELDNIIQELPQYDIFQLLWIEDDWVLLADKIRRKCKYLNICVGGSDFYRSNKNQLEGKRIIIRMADCVTAETVTTIQNFLEVFPEVRLRTKLLNFGIEELEYIGKTELLEDLIYFGLPINKVIVTCGYNAVRAQQHERIIKEIEKMDPSIHNKTQFVFPLTYGDYTGEYVSSIQELLTRACFDNMVLTRFMSVEEMARYASCSDVLINMQITDQLSSKMLQEMYAGSVVIAGSWLPYQQLIDEGIYFVSIDSIDELVETLTDVIGHLNEYKERCKGNRDIVYRMSSWNNVAEKWMRMWNEELQG